MLISRDNQICLEFAFWKSRPPVALGGIYEMRTYLLKVRLTHPFPAMMQCLLSLHLVEIIQVKMQRVRHLLIL
jgi:hypothetical protein